MTQTPKFTSSIVIHNSPLPQIALAISSLLRCPELSRIYLLDNGSSPLPQSLLSDSRIDYRRIPNNGFGAAHNIALREVTALYPDGFHLVMNPDVSWEGDALMPLLNFMKENPDVGLVQPRIVYADGTLQYTCRMLPAPLDLFAKRFLPRSLAEKRMQRYLLACHDHHRPLNVPYLQGSFLLFRNKALIECGLFDERFFLYPEDIDITRRIHEKWQTLFLPEVEICHLHNAESRRNPRLFAIHLVNMMKYFNKWGWVADPQRKLFNKRLLESVIPVPPGEREPGRG